MPKDAFSFCFKWHWVRFLRVDVMKVNTSKDTSAILYKTLIVWVMLTGVILPSYMRLIKDIIIRGLYEGTSSKIPYKRFFCFTLSKVGNP